MYMLTLIVYGKFSIPMAAVISAYWNYAHLTSNTAEYTSQ